MSNILKSPFELIPKFDQQGKRSYATHSSNYQTAYELKTQVLHYRIPIKESNYFPENIDHTIDRWEEEIQYLKTNPTQDSKYISSLKGIYYNSLLIKQNRLYIHSSPTIPFPNEKINFPNNTQKNEFMAVMVPEHIFCLYYDATTKKKYLLDNNGIKDPKHSQIKSFYENEKYEIVTWGENLTYQQKENKSKQNAINYSHKNPNLLLEDLRLLQNYCGPTAQALMQIFYEKKEIDVNAFKQGKFNVLEQLENYVNGIGSPTPLQRKNSILCIHQKPPVCVKTDTPLQELRKIQFQKPNQQLLTT